jgi:hypothetical protein
MRIEKTPAGWLDLNHVLLVGNLIPFQEPEYWVYRDRPHHSEKYYSVDLTLMFVNDPVKMYLGAAKYPWDYDRVKKKYEAFIAQWKGGE